MVTTVELQNPMEYSLGIILLAAGLLLGAILIGVIIALWIRSRNKKNAEAEEKTVKRVRKESGDRRKKKRSSGGKVSRSSDNIPEAKRKYIERIQDISSRYKAGTVNKRAGYQELSAVIRAFVNEYAGINTTYLTAAEVKAAPLQASLSFTISRSLFKLMSTESMMPSHPLLPPSPALSLSQHLCLFQ